MTKVTNNFSKIGLHNFKAVPKTVNGIIGTTQKQVDELTQLAAQLDLDNIALEAKLTKLRAEITEISETIKDNVEQQERALAIAVKLSDLIR